MKHRPRTTGFTLVEVMIASLVLVFGILTALAAMQQGFQALDRARTLGLATQLMQSEMERVRLKTWTQLEELQARGSESVTFENTQGVPASGFTCTRQISSIKTDMKEITLTAEWRSFDGRPQTAKLISRYAKAGLNDYLTTAR